jgi:PAS domain S-box-containing protein
LKHNGSKEGEHALHSQGVPAVQWNSLKPVQFSSEWALPLLEQSGLILFKLDLRSGQGSFSRTAHELLGFSHEELERDPAIVAKSLHPDDAKAYTEFVRRQVENPQPRAQTRLHFRARDGRDVWVDCLVFPVRGAGGELEAFQGVAWDATDLVRAQKMAQEGRERFRLLFDSAPLALMLFSPETLLIRQANRRACEMYGTSRGELEGSFLSEHIAPEEWPRAQASIRNPAPAVSVVHRTLNRRVDGTVFPVQVVGVSVRVDGVPLRLIAVRDLTEEEAAAENVKSLYRALDASPTGVLVLDPSWCIEHVNGACAAASGHTPDDMRGRDFAAYIDPSSLVQFGEMRERAETGSPAQGEIKIRRGSGAPVAATVDVTPVFGASPLPERYIARIHPRDTSDPAAAPAPPPEAELFFDLLAHDVTNYLTAVRGYLELSLASGELSPKVERLAAVALLQSENALGLVRETRRVVELQRDSSASEATGDLLKLLDESVARIEPLVQDRKLKVRRAYRPSEAPVHHAELLREVFVNLLHNAIKFDAHPELIVDLEVEKVAREGVPYFRVRVADRGSGIPDADKPHLFTRGYRAAPKPKPAATAMAPAGSGVGLSICKFLIEKNGGTIDVENRIPGDHTQGTVFVIMLPAA